jgi:hypothetical protein
VHTFSSAVILKTAGTQSLTATDKATSSITGSLALPVVAAAAKTFALTGLPTSTTAGLAQNFTVTAKDSYGNIATGYVGTVHFRSSDKQAALPANYTFLASDAGVHPFSVTLKTAGAQTITAADTVTGSIAGTSASIKVNPAKLDHFKVTAPSTCTAGSAISVSVTVQDAYGNTIPSYTGTIHFSSGDKQAMLPADYTFTSVDSGVHTFTNAVTLKTTGKQTVTVMDTVTTSAKGSATVAVSAPKTSPLRIETPWSVTRGTSFTMAALDAYGNVALRLLQMAWEELVNAHRLAQGVDPATLS